MKGHYLLGLPFITLDIQGRKFDVLVDTGFNGDLMLPREFIKELRLSQTGIANYILADGGRSSTDVFEVELDWLGKSRVASVVSAETDIALLGMRMLYPTETSLIPRNGVIQIKRV